LIDGGVDIGQIMMGHSQPVLPSTFSSCKICCINIFVAPEVDSEDL